MTTKIAILGSTGSIGTQTLQLVDRYPERFSVAALTSNTNAELLLEQIIRYKPLYAAMADEKAAQTIAHKIPESTHLLTGQQGLLEIASVPEADTLVVAVVGIAGLPIVMKGIAAGKRIALANKEALVTGGAMVTAAMAARGDRILPVDSEHSAIFQCMNGENPSAIRRLILTASGGPFHNTLIEKFSEITLARALKHPNWKMGRKITIDSATLMNKGLEVMEACWLFNMPMTKIDVIIHPESIIHSMVEYNDGAVMAQMSNPDMRLPILYALEYPAQASAYPERRPCGVKPLDLLEIGKLTFSKPDLQKFPCLGLAYQVMRMGGTAPTVLNAANEVAVEWFLREKIHFCDIPKLIEHTIFHTEIIDHPSLDDIYETDRQVREVLHGNDNWKRG